MFKKESKIKRFDFILLFTVVLLSIYGCIMINSATMSTASGSSPFLKTQITALVLGFILVTFMLFIDYDLYGNLYIPIYVVTILFLIYTLINPVKAENWGGVRSWIAIGKIVFQPAEIAKFGVIISLAKYIDIHKENINNPFVLIKVLAFAFLPVGLILIQPDFGTAVVFIFFIAVMIFIAGIDYKYIISVIMVLVILFIIGLVIFLNLMQDYVPTENYQLDRIVNFLYPESDPQDTGYQVIQSKIAIGSGMFDGRGINKGVQNQLGYLPTKETDFIFAVIGEELGFIGGAFLLLLYAIMFFRLIKIAKSTSNMFGSLIVTGIIAMLFFHIFENIGMTMGLVPVTGIPLPFISYGGTFSLVNVLSIGFALSVGMKKNKIDLNDL